MNWAPHTLQSDVAQKHVIIVDDDVLFRDLVTRNLSESGFRVTGYGDGPSILNAYDGRDEAEIILLDWVMPQMTGIEVLRQLRAKQCSTPIIFLTMLTDQIYEEAALLGGAIDFVEKSRSFAILLKRIEVALSRTPALTAGPVGAEQTTPADIQLLADSKRIVWKGQEIGLTLTEYNVVQHMIARGGKDLSYRELYDLVHGEGFVGGYGEIGYRTNVRALIKRVRQKFRDADPGFDRIENYPGFGYRWRNDSAP
jgi:two-component system response regulator ChvI